MIAKHKIPSGGSWFRQLSRACLDKRHFGKYAPFGATGVVFCMWRYVEDHRLAAGYGVGLPAGDEFVVGVSGTGKGEKGFAHDIGDGLRLFAGSGSARLVDIVEYQLDVGSMGSTGSAAVFRGGPVELVGIGRKA